MATLGPQPGTLRRAQSPIWYIQVSPRDDFHQQNLGKLLRPREPGSATKPNSQNIVKNGLSTGVVTRTVTGSVIGLALCLALGLFAVLHRRPEVRLLNALVLSGRRK